MPVLGNHKNIARVVRPHGSKGEVIVVPLRGLPFLLHEGMRVALTPPALKRERFSTVERIRGNFDSPCVLFSCARDLDAAESLVNCYVLADSDDLDMGPLDIAFDDLLGRTVQDVRHGELGAIREILETPANDVWVVDGGAYGEVLIPVIESVVNDIPDSGSISVRIMDGLIDA